MGYGLHGLGKDDELRTALKQQQQMLDAAKAQTQANADMQLNKRDAFMIVLGIMAIMLIFK